MEIRQAEKKIVKRIKSWADQNEGIDQLEKFSDRSTLSMVLLGGLVMEIVKQLIIKYAARPIRGFVAALTGVIVANIVWTKAIRTAKEVEEEALEETDSIETKIKKVENNLEDKLR